MELSTLKIWDGEKYIDIKTLEVLEKGEYVKCNDIYYKGEYEDSFGNIIYMFRAYGIKDGKEREIIFIPNSQQYMI